MIDTNQKYTKNILSKITIKKSKSSVWDSAPAHMQSYFCTREELWRKHSTRCRGAVMPDAAHSSAVELLCVLLDIGDGNT